MKALFTVAALLALSACGSTDRVNFVTTTSIAIQGDTRTADASIGYNRFEGVVGPAYDTGALPPVASAMNSDLEIFSPSISQAYATGDAARVITGGQAKNGSLPLTGKRRVMVFGTGTTVGLKLGFGTTGPQSITLGYKRIEFSSLPIGEKKSADGKKTGDVYGSVLASVELDVDGDNVNDKSLKLAQLFASGDAAVKLAENPKLKDLFIKRAERVLTADLGCTDINHDGNTATLLQFHEADPGNPAILRRDMNLLGLKDVEIPKLLGCARYASHRAKLAQHYADQL